ncbi:MFS transporter [Burkholderia sp. AU31624]|uniref:MFS transporter n=1 Tax=Burkholderia sp. AU31624 TaxID=2879629 RepID=UPI001CF2921B|nr:MFS transporter [Burkholderia sp. AU31624]MCA8252563.1 MFS transporter [Burkholderia sp. AU31624]
MLVCRLLSVAHATSTGNMRMTSTTHAYRNMLALAAICLAGVMFHLEISSVPIILPTLEVKLGADFADLQWIMNAYTIACTTVLMAVGTLADRYGRRRIFVLSLNIFGVASLICGLAENTYTLIASRFLQGIGGGAMMICQIANLSHQFQEGKERSQAFAMWGFVFGVGLGLGPLIGGVIVTLLNWRWIFLVHVPLVALTLVLTYVGIDESRNPQAGKLDLGGMATLSAAVFGLTYLITQRPGLGATGMSGIAAVVILFIAFIVIENRSAHPMFMFSVFRIRNVSGALMGSIAMNFSFWPFNIYLPIYFRTVLGYDAVNAGMLQLAYTLPTLLIPPLAERLSLRYQARVIIPAGLMTIGVGFFLMLIGNTTLQAGWAAMVPGCIIAGIGLGLTNTPVTNAVTGSVPAARAGMASGIDMSARLITFAVNISLMGFILLEGIRANLRHALPASFDDAQVLAMAGKVAAGSGDELRRAFPALMSADASGAITHAALVHGFSIVMLYGGVGAAVLAVISRLIFGGKLQGVPQPDMLTAAKN